MPPIPITGIFTARAACQAMRTATGRMAGPESPPVPNASFGRRVSTSTARPSRVLMQESASAPASAAARAKTVMSATLGESLGITGSRVALRTAATTSWVIRGSPPNAIPPFSTLGQEMLISRPATPGAPSRIRVTSAYSSTVSPQTLTSTTVSKRRRRGRTSLTKFRTPTPCRPIALSRPDGVSAMRGSGHPSRGSR